MKESIVTQFVRDDQFYFRISKSRLASGDYLSAISYLYQAKRSALTKDKFLGENYNVVLGQIYSLLDEYELSNYFYFSALKNSFLSQVAYRGLGENFLSCGNEALAIYYLDLCVKVREDSPVAMLAKELLNELEKIDEKEKRFIVIEGKNRDKKELLFRAQECLSCNKFGKAITYFEQYGNFDNEKIRSDLSTAYIFDNKCEKGLSLIKKYGSDSLDDLSNLLMIYSNLEDDTNFNKTMASLKNYKPKNEEECFKLGVILSGFNEEKLGLYYLDKYFLKANFDYDLQLIYCQICISAKEYDLAKKKLIDLKTFNPFNSYIIDFYLDIIDKKIDYKFKNLGGLSSEVILKVKSKIREYLVLDEKKLKVAFSKDEKFFYFVSTFNEGNLKNLLLLRLSKINYKPINDFFRRIMLKNDAKASFKIELVKNRLLQDTINSFEFTKNNLYVKIVLPNKKLLKAYNLVLYEACKNCLNYILYKTELTDINLQHEFTKMHIKNIAESEDSRVVSSYILWDYLGHGKIKVLNQICDYFKVTKQQILDFADKYELYV